MATLPPTSQGQPVESAALPQNSLEFDARYDALVTQLHETRAQHERIHQQFQRVMAQRKAFIQQMLTLRSQLAEKRALIQLLLPYYPHPLTAEQRRQAES